MNVTKSDRHKLRLIAGCAMAMSATWLNSVSSAVDAAQIASWTFESSVPATAGPFAPESGAGSATGSHSGSTVYSSPSGNGSPHSFSSTNWSIGDYYQFQVSTSGLDAIQLSWDQASSNTGPRDFQLAYSTDGTNFTNIGLVYAVLANASPNPVWTNATPQPVFNFTRDLTSIAAIDNAANVFFRLSDASTVSANGGTVASGATDRVDNFTVSGSVAVAPEPSSIAMALVGLVALSSVAVGRRKT